MSEQKKLHLQTDYLLEAGDRLSNIQIGYHSYGQLNANKDNVIWVCHALTGDSDVLNWWSGLFGEHDLFNPEDYYIVCANVLGAPYGTTNPLSFKPKSKKKYYHNFPDITIRDIAGLHQILADHLGIEKIELLIGGSMGGHQALEWAILEPKRFVNLALIATSAIHSAWGVAFNATQRMAISNDPTWKKYHDEAGINGMKVARSIALLSYRNYGIYKEKQTEPSNNALFPWKAVSYQLYQGEKIAKRFNAFSYWVLSKAMDSMNVGRNRGGLENALSLIKANTIVITMENDWLFPKEDQLFLAKQINNATHVEINTKYGHDGFLVETEQISHILESFLHPSTDRLPANLNQPYIAKNGKIRHRLHS